MELEPDQKQTVKPKAVKPKKPPTEKKKLKIKIERKKRSYNFRKKNDILHDTDLNEEISALSSTGLKNQLHTLKLSRLMVRAEQISARIKLLDLLITAELPCRRLFLDYHGLRILNGWMDSCKDITSINELQYRQKILATLEVLPITNKTILKDSKVLTTTQKWANEFNPNANSSSTVTEEEKIDESPNESSNDSKDDNLPVCPPDTNNLTVQIKPEIQADISNIIKQNQQFIQGLDLNELRNIIGICGKKEDSNEVNTDDQLSTKTDSSLIQTDHNHVCRSNTPPLIGFNFLTRSESNEKVESTPTAEIKTEVKPDSEPEPVSEEVPMDVSEPDLIVKPEETEIQESLPESKNEKDESNVEQVNVEQLNDNKLPSEVAELQNEIYELISKLLKSWESLKENFRIPKKERIEQMKEHEREADLRYQALKCVDDKNINSEKRALSRYHREDHRDKRHSHSYLPPPLPPEEKSRSYGYEKSTSLRHNISKHQRRQMFEMQVAQQESEREIWNCHVQNCIKFGLDPYTTAASDVPSMVNPITGQYFSFDHRPIPTPPSHVSQ